MSDEQNYNVNDVRGKNINIGGNQTIHEEHKHYHTDGSGKPRVFISYSRTDGEQFATQLRQRLEGIGLTLWQDRDRMEGGVGWWKQITDALEDVEFMVLVATPAAITSPVVKKEWRYARQQGVCVYPVQVPGLTLDFAAMPKWMRDSHFYNLDHEWDTFVNYLKSPCTVPRVPFMAPDLPEFFVQRPDTFSQLIAQLLDKNRDNPVAITTALSGAGGFGKTTLATALCHDEDVQTAFDEGVLWVTLGEHPNILNALTILYRALTDDTPNFVNVEEGATKLAEKLVDADVLLVIDDVWDTAHLKPFMRGGERTARLVTTRFSNIAVDHNAKLLNVDEMQTSEAVALLLAGIKPKPDDTTPFQQLAERLGEWALMLELANGMLREEILEGVNLDDALEYVNEVLDDEGIHGIEGETSDERKQSAAGVLAASLRQLKDDEITRLCELSIFAEDTNVPATSVQALWNLKSTRARKLLTRLARGSFVRFDRERGTIRLHDVVREVLATRLDDATAVHTRLIDNYGDLTTLPDEYAWRNLAYHLTEADRKDELAALLTNFDYLYNKLTALRDPNTLIADCDVLPDNMTVTLMRSALGISSHLLGEPVNLSQQLYGRLMTHRETPAIGTLLQQSEQPPNLLLQTTTLHHAGGALIRTIYVDSSVRSIYVDSSMRSIALTDDGRYALSGSDDHTIRVWNWKTGKELRTLEGHTAPVNSVVVSGDFALSGSKDRTLRVWNWKTGEVLRIFEGSYPVNSVVVSSEFVLSGIDWEVKVWNWKTGEVLRTLTLEGNIAPVNSVVVSGDFALSASEDHTIRVWNWKTGVVLRTLEGHIASVNSVVVSGDFALSASEDRTIRVWKWKMGKELRILEGHTRGVNSVVMSGDFALSGSDDGTVRIWKWKMGRALRVIEGNTVSVESVVVSGDFAPSENDQEVKVWNWKTEEELRTLEGHTRGVNSVVMSGDFALSASDDHTVRIWNWKTGEVLRIFERHTRRVNSVVMSGDFALSGSDDGTLRVWNWKTGEELRIFEGSYPVNSVVVSSEFVLSGIDWEVKVWNWKTGALLRRLSGHTGRVNPVVVSGDFALSGSDDRKIRVWNWKTGEGLRKLEAHTNSVDTVVVSGDFVLSTSIPSSAFIPRDYSVEVWNWRTGDYLQPLVGHTGFVNSMVASGDFALSGAYDRTMRVWNWQTGECLYVFHADAPVLSVAISEDRRMVVVGDQAGNVHFLRPNAALLRLMGVEDEYES